MNWTELQTELLARLKAKRGGQAELARRLGISRAAVSAYASTDDSIPPAHLNTILDILEIELAIKPKGSS